MEALLRAGSAEQSGAINTALQEKIKTRHVRVFFTSATIQTAAKMCLRLSRLGGIVEYQAVSPEQVANRDGLLLYSGSSPNTAKAVQSALYDLAELSPISRGDSNPEMQIWLK
ncbi:MAG: hypothetical protein ACJ8AT_05775 [Hyalangium sp.]|uniref:hypothetical protein n=1 Tax=Hyalangium sp. TaxID=2028555 RepID=UPI00389A775E